MSVFSRVGERVRDEFRDAPGAIVASFIGLAAVAALATPKGQELASDLMVSAGEAVFGTVYSDTPAPLPGELPYGGVSASEVTRIGNVSPLEETWRTQCHAIVPNPFDNTLC